jgi:hypothetical protein
VADLAAPPDSFNRILSLLAGLNLTIIIIGMPAVKHFLQFSKQLLPFESFEQLDVAVLFVQILEFCNSWLRDKLVTNPSEEKRRPLLSCGRGWFRMEEQDRWLQSLWSGPGPFHEDENAPLFLRKGFLIC